MLNVDQFGRLHLKTSQQVRRPIGSFEVLPTKLIDISCVTVNQFWLCELAYLATIARLQVSCKDKDNSNVRYLCQPQEIIKKLGDRPSMQITEPQQSISTVLQASNCLLSSSSITASSNRRPLNGDWANLSTPKALIQFTIFLVLRHIYYKNGHLLHFVLNGTLVFVSNVVTVSTKVKWGDQEQNISVLNSIID